MAEHINTPKRLGRMPQLTELRAPEDDWTGVTKSADRRKRQNRLNQRAYRRRKLEQNDGKSVVTQSWPLDGYLMVEDPQRRAVTYAFMQLAQMQYTLKNHRLTYLPSLIRLNAANALSHNARTLGIPLEGLCSDEMISQFNAFGPKTLDGVIVKQNFPENLRPTQLQSTFAHHPWSDLLPAPRLRDNILHGIKNDVFDEDELCCDLLSVVSSRELDEAFLIVWGDPTDVYGWEVSVGFFKKWGWLLRGCPEMIEATNRWRQQRGESKIEFLV
ncbi:uncharacterized protein NECHADRAFT_74062 [Fusarium vanettenii 77-13-4]|uniref:BZIP domain-containing protein n=1 Tax=Fusarium vanettenii (strain ATCC MYA-4622 / CBS 123669 / FGSC 9596 / NRRL 45880 / 77-13-4) TaxID=660122 RepID=C7YVS6_FUSV7|nr:uncharacterized protein NECHADRAFT_74062 [Fusarium vanettenii 77-13-4]EEU44049.1 hypothetical protein NECHADRAFT_74062 [Fusarium vanettenii 77-13-4]